MGSRVVAYVEGVDEVKPSDLPEAAPILRAADEPDNWELESWMGKGRPSIFMPRWASRISLLVTDVSAERVQDITDMGALHEGISTNEGKPLRDAFQMLWDQINGKREGAAWGANPWVWVIKFEVIS